ncbi:MAG: hypothetical protein U1A27_07610 [Phycisphaerae bacterium]
MHSATESPTSSTPPARRAWAVAATLAVGALVIAPSVATVRAAAPRLHAAQFSTGGSARVVSVLAVLAGATLAVRALLRLRQSGLQPSLVASSTPMRRRPHAPVTRRALLISSRRGGRCGP